MNQERLRRAEHLLYELIEIKVGIFGPQRPAVIRQQFLRIDGMTPSDFYHAVHSLLTDRKIALTEDIRIDIP